MEVSWGLGLSLEGRPCPRGAVGGCDHPVPCHLGILTAVRPPCDLGHVTLCLSCLSKNMNFIASAFGRGVWVDDSWLRPAGPPG